MVVSLFRVPGENESGPRMLTGSSSLSREANEPWRCMGCHELIYNLKNGYPAPGAPQPYFFSSKFPKVCLTCFDMANAVTKKTN